MVSAEAYASEGGAGVGAGGLLIPVGDAGADFLKKEFIVCFLIAEDASAEAVAGIVSFFNGVF